MQKIRLIWKKGAKEKVLLLFACLASLCILATSVYGIKKLKDKFSPTTTWHLVTVDNMDVKTYALMDGKKKPERMVNLIKDGNSIMEESYRNKGKVASAKAFSPDMSGLKDSKFTNLAKSKVQEVDQPDSNTLIVTFEDGQIYLFRPGTRTYKTDEELEKTEKEGGN